MAEDPKQINLVTLLGIGAGFGICVGVGIFLGVLGDHAWGTSPLLALAGLAVGIFGGAASAFAVIRPYTRSNPAPISTASITTQSARPDEDVRSDEQ